MKSIVRLLIIATSCAFFVLPGLSFSLEIKPWQWEHGRSLNTGGVTEEGLYYGPKVWGYRFTPKEQGVIKALGGHFKGVRHVVLYKDGVSQPVATVRVAGGDTPDWTYQNLAVPIEIEVGTNYTVAMAYQREADGYVRPSRHARIRDGEGNRLLPVLPYEDDSLIIHEAVWGYYHSGNPEAPGQPHYSQDLREMIGQPDIVFETNSQEGPWSPSVEVNPIPAVAEVYVLNGIAQNLTYNVGIRITNNERGVYQFPQVTYSYRLFQVGVEEAIGGDSATIEPFNIQPGLSHDFYLPLVISDATTNTHLEDGQNYRIEYTFSGDMTNVSPGANPAQDYPPIMFDVNVSQVQSLEQTVWQAVREGTDGETDPITGKTVNTNLSLSYSYGFQFVPTASGYITELGGDILGEKTLRLWGPQPTYELLAEMTIDAGDNPTEWTYAKITNGNQPTPVPVEAGETYTVSISAPNHDTRGSYHTIKENYRTKTFIQRYADSDPIFHEDIIIKQAVYAFGSTQMPYRNGYHTIHGQPDIKFNRTVSSQPPEPTLPTVNVTGLDINEGDSGEQTLLFTISLSEPVPEDAESITVYFETQDATATSIGNEADYRHVNNSIVFQRGEQAHTVGVAIFGDTREEGGIEAQESFNFVLTEAINANIGQAVAVGNILDDDFTERQITIDNRSVVEGHSGVTEMRFNVTVNPPLTRGQVSVSYATEDGTAQDGSTLNEDHDYDAKSGTLVFIANESSKTISVNIHGDLMEEIDETFTLQLSDPVNARLLTTFAEGEILNDDSSAPVSSILEMRSNFVNSNNGSILNDGDTHTYGPDQIQGSNRLVIRHLISQTGLSPLQVSNANIVLEISHQTQGHQKSETDTRSFPIPVLPDTADQGFSINLSTGQPSCERYLAYDGIHSFTLTISGDFSGSPLTETATLNMTYDGDRVCPPIGGIDPIN